MITRRHLVGLAAASALAPVVSPRIARAQSSSQQWPSRIVKLVAPFPPGGGTDVVARILTNRLSEVWGQQVIVENKPGAGGNFGAEQVARSDPDGYTILIAALPMAVNRFLFRSLSYDSITDFAPVIMVCQFPNLLVVPNSSPAKSVQELIAHGKANNGKLTFASSGVGTSPHLSGELFKRMAGFEMTHVPYRGVAPALSDVIPGRVDMMFNTAAGVLQQVRAGQVRGLAVSTMKRFPTAPEFPTVAESGLPGFDVTSWYALFVPIKTSADIVKKIHADTAAILAEPAIKTRLEQVGVEVVASTPQALGARLKAETEQWGPIIKAAGIKTQD
jgi:tripartite-type tricarboxylate transporter receptor subunit TctC